MDPRIKAARRIIEAEYAKKLTVPELVKRAGVSRSHLAFLCKQETGLTLKACLRQMRLRKAAELLAQDHVSIKQAWLTVGYDHASNFSRDFKTYFGHAPSDYRLKVTAPLLPDLPIAPISPWNLVFLGRFFANPSPVPRRLVKTPSRATLSPKGARERLHRNLLRPRTAGPRCATCYFCLLIFAFALFFFEDSLNERQEWLANFRIGRLVCGSVALRGPGQQKHSVPAWRPALRR